MNITGPMTLSWLPNTTQGRMVGDYISTSFNSTAPDTAFPAFAAAIVPTGGTDCSVAGVTCHEAIDSVTPGLSILSGHNTASADRVVASNSQPASLSPATSR